MLQSLVEKHFPAPDRQKLYSLLGIDLSAKKTPSLKDSAPEPEQKGMKRKGTTTDEALVKLKLLNTTCIVTCLPLCGAARLRGEEAAE